MLGPCNEGAELGFALPGEDGLLITVEGEARREGGCNFCNYTFKFTLKTEWRDYNHM